MKEELSASTDLSHYRIVSRIGAGGMGEVYIAQDTRLDRKVAMKLLPAEFTKEPDRVRRFEQEAKAASALNHPYIVTIHEIGESEAGRFIVMELVEGQTLAAIERPCPLDNLLSLASQIAQALAASHAAGIIHRDIKPENIMVRDDGYVKVLDFGLARLLPSGSAEEAATLAQQTTPGMIVGTLAYMSPEQASGQSASSASDIFSLGIVLYELATGRHPFKSDTFVGYLQAITLQRPQSIRLLDPSIPADLEALILRMLDKQTSGRPTAGEVARRLEAMERSRDSSRGEQREDETAILPSARSGPTNVDDGFWVAVLPFKCRSANADLEALAEGLSEDIVTGLSRFSYLRVIARGSTLRYAGDPGDVRAIGKELGARYVMEGSLRQAGSQLRLAVQLVDAATGAHLWAENYERAFNPNAVFQLQDDLAPRIVSTVADMHGVLPRSMSDAVRSSSPDQLSPYEAVLRSFGYFERVTAEDLAAARFGLKAALQKSPTYADAWAMLAMLCVQDYAQGFDVDADSLPNGTAAAQRAVELAPSNNLAYFSLAQALFFQKEFHSFRNAAQRAFALNTMDGNSIALLAEMVAYSGDWERGLELGERAKQLNPHHPGWYWHVNFNNAYRQRDYRGALGFAHRMNATTNWAAHALMAAAHGQLGDHEAASKALRELLKLKPDAAATLRDIAEKWFDAEHGEHLIEGFRKAGLEIADKEVVSTSAPGVSGTDRSSA